MWEACDVPVKKLTGSAAPARFLLTQQQYQCAFNNIQTYSSFLKGGAVTHYTEISVNFKLLPMLSVALGAYPHKKHEKYPAAPSHSTWKVILFV